MELGDRSGKAMLDPVVGVSVLFCGNFEDMVNFYYKFGLFLTNLMFCICPLLAQIPLQCVFSTVLCKNQSDHIYRFWCDWFVIKFMEIK